MMSLTRTLGARCGRSVAAILCAAAMLGAPAETSDCALAPDVVAVGAGSYAAALPSGAREPAAVPFVTASAKRPVPTSRWWSSLVFTPFSNQMHPHPLAVQAHDTGLRVYYPGVGYTANSIGIFVAAMGPPNDLVIGHSAQATFPDARADSWSDWFVTASFAVAKNRLLLTLGHGSPFVYGTIEGGSPTFTFGGAPSVFAGDARSPTLGVTFQGRSYGLFGPTGCRWEGIGTSRLTCVGKPYFSIALLPDNTKETLSFFARYAHSHVIDSRVSWAYDEKTSKVTTTYTYTTKPYEGSETDALFCLYPHQYRRSTTPLTKHTYQSVRGVLKLAAGRSFTTVTPFHGVLPLLPDIGTHDRAALKRYLDSDAASYKPEIADTYWTGKALGKLATLSAIADASGNQAANEQFRSRLRSLLEAYLSAGPDGQGKPGESRGLFYYNRAWGTLIGYPASYGSDEALNDHHFHYGYFIRAAAELVRQEPAWGSDRNWGGMIRLLARDIACADRDDPMFPFLRSFDIYEGHSWADGKGDFADGNNNESSSEAMNAWTGLILWGALTGDRRTRDAGIYLYVTEKDAIETYWFDVHALYPRTFGKPMVSMVWGAKAVYETWFSADPITKHGINILPVQSGSLYLGHDPEYVRRNVAGLAAERIAADGKDPKRAPNAPPRVGPNWGGWGDIILMYQALSDAAAAIRDCDFDKQEIEGGNSRANLYHWMHFLDKVGHVDASVTADTPLYAVFNKGGRRTYVVYSAVEEPRRVTFSDGAVVATARRGLHVK